MRRTTKVPIVLVALLFVLAAAAEVATSRGKHQPDNATQPMHRAALETVAEALACSDVEGPIQTTF